MRGAYVATPLPAVVALLPYDWNPNWPYPGPHPPGYDTPKDPELTFLSPPTPDEVAVDEEITASVILRDISHELPMPTPEDGTSDITWYAELEGAVIWSSTTSWSTVSGYPGASKTFTPPLTENDEGKILTLHAQSTVVFDDLLYPVSAEHDIDIVPKIPVAFEGYATFNSWNIFGACNPRLSIQTTKSGTSNRDWPQIGMTDYSEPWEGNWWGGYTIHSLPEVTSVIQWEGDIKRIDVSIVSLLTDGMYSVYFFTDRGGGYTGSFTFYAKVTYDDDSFDEWTKNFTYPENDSAGIVLDRRGNGYVEASDSWD